ncbi:Hint domain-containing protein [Asaia lannensis]|uniref:Hint domain-containing protein n=1 Tax=Asaia lannensis TaxID=415421 RepID=UPI001C98F8EC
MSLGSWGSANYYGAIIGSNGVVTVNGSNKQGNVDPTGILQAVGFFNIAGNTVNNGTMNIGWTSLYNYKSTGNITGNGTINLQNVTLASDFRGNQYCYWFTSFQNISGQTINMTNSQIAFGDRNGGGSISNVTINCSGGNNYIAINAGMLGSVTNLKIRGFGGGDKLDLGSWGMADWCSYDPSTGILTVSTYYPNITNIVSVQIDIGLGYDPDGFSLGYFFTGASGDAGLTYLGAPPCYLTGTLIETARGPVAVEEITLADRVVAYDNGQEVLRQVVWTGKSHVKADRSPVIVRQGALADNVPSRDLHVTEEHCLFLEGRFVPVRMLVNGHSIVSDTRHEDYDVYHIELDTHSVIKANDVLSESFLDTGHLTFEGREVRNLSWERDSAAPLCTDRSFVEPLFRKIAARVPGLVVPASDTSPEHQTEIALLVNGRTRVTPTRRNGKNVVFTIDEPIRSLHVLAEAAAPSVRIGPFVDDRRQLGALVGEVHLFTPEGMVPHRKHLEADALTGWHEKESGQYRWTGAQAELPDIQSESDSAILSLALYA